MLLNERKAQARTSRFPGAGKPVYSDYNSITVSLASTFAQQAGTLNIVAAAADFASCDRVIVEFKILDKRTSKDNALCPCDFQGRAEILIPTPAPADIAAFVAENIRKHSIIASNAVTAVNGADLKWTMLRAGYELVFTAIDNAQGKAPTLTTTITTPSATGSIPTIPAGSALWMHPSITSNSPMRSRVAATGWASAPSGPSNPRFLGVLRKEDVLNNYDCECTRPLTDNCHTAIIHGAVEIELEIPLTVWPADPVIAARHTSDPAVNNGLVGGYQVIDRAAAAPAGMSALLDVDIYDVKDRKAIIYLT